MDRRLELPGEQTRPHPSVQWAASAKWFHGPGRLKWLSDHDFGIEFTPNADDLDEMRPLLQPSIDQNVPFRFHAFFPDHEFGDMDGNRAKRAMELHQRMFAAVAEIYPDTNITCHIGLTPCCRLDSNRLIDHLAILVELAKKLGLNLSIENLKAGISSDPLQILRWADAADASITMDLGHALSSEPVLSGMISVHEMIDLFAPRLVEIHYYERETTSHHGPETMRTLGSVVEHLLNTSCRWWTIELDELPDIHHTRSISEAYMGTQKVSL